MKKCCLWLFRFDRLSCIKHNQSLGSLLVHDPVAALSAPDSVPGSDLVLAVTLAADVDHRSLHLRVLVSVHDEYLVLKY